jgi:hypothetical protein
MADVNVTSTDTVDVVGLDNLKADLKLELPQPLETSASQEITVNPVSASVDAKNELTLNPISADTKSELKVDPLSTDSSMTIDLKPAVVDLCATINIGKLPNACIKQPYHHHVGFTLWGAEVWGMTFSGEQSTIIEPGHPGPAVSLGREESWTPPPRPPEPPSRETGGLRIRLGS